MNQLKKTNNKYFFYIISNGDISQFVHINLIYIQSIAHSFFRVFAIIGCFSLFQLSNLSKMKSNLITTLCEIFNPSLIQFYRVFADYEGFSLFQLSNLSKIKNLHMTTLCEIFNPQSLFFFLGCFGNISYHTLFFFLCCLGNIS